MISILRDFRAALVGDEDWDAALRRGEVRLALGPTAALAAGLDAWYGLCLGSHTWAMGAAGYRWQPLVSAVKLPLLFAIVAAVAYPSLYVLNLVAGPRLGARAVARLLAGMFAAMAAVLAGFGPPIALFGATAGYSFTILAHVAFCGVAGVCGLAFLARSLRRLSAAPAAGRRRGGIVALAGWCVVLAVVGIQVGWSMRPIVGWTEIGFTLFRPPDMTFLEGIRWEWRNLGFS